MVKLCINQEELYGYSGMYWIENSDLASHLNALLMEFGGFSLH